MERLAPVQITAFIKDWDTPDLITNYQNNECLIERLNKVGAVPAVLAYATTNDPDGYIYKVIMEKVPGYDLLNVPESEEGFMYSLAAAQKLAGLFKKIADEGIRHMDPHAGNIMFDQKKRDFVFIDLEGLTERHIDANEWVFHYCLVLGDVYFGMDPLNNIEDVYEISEEQKSKLMPIYEKYGAKKSFYQLLADIDIANEFVDALDLQDVVNPQVISFISKGLMMGVSNFDGVLGIETVEKM